MVENTDFTPPVDPWKLFQTWYELAEINEPVDPNAMSLATVSGNGMPSVRIVLMKDYDERGFVFFTNRESRKGMQLLVYPKGAICMHWKSLKRQIRAEGSVKLVSEAESNAYYATRPRGSQIGSWASQQSRPLTDRATLEQRVRELEKEYDDKPVPRPHYWGGYRLTPLMLEFWQEREDRLHDRIVYRRNSDKDPWITERLFP